jgi:hypothetical protein
MTVQKMTHWVFIFALLTGMTVWILQPHSSGTKEVLAYAAETNAAAVVMPYRDVKATEERILKRLLNAFIPRDLVCTVNDAQADELSSRYATETDTVEIDGKNIPLLKIRNTRNVNSGQIMQYLRSSGSEPHCVVVPSSTWYYTLLTGTVS